MELIATIETASGLYAVGRLGPDRWAVTSPHRLRPVEFQSRLDAEAWIGRPVQRQDAADLATAA